MSPSSAIDSTFAFGDDVDAALAEDAHQQLAHLLIDGCQDVGQHLDDGYFCAERIEHTGQFHADHAAADTDDAFRRLRQVPAGIAIHHVASIDAREGRDERDGAGGENDLVRAELLLLSHRSLSR